MELFDDLPDQPAPRRPEGRARVLSAVRDQVELVTADLDSLLEADHQARRVWAFVQSLDLSPLYEVIRVREATVGRPAIDPAILMALWLYATIDGVGSARLVARLCRSTAAYRWICGGVSVNHHTLSDFRVHHADFLDEVLAHSVATLHASGLVQLQEIAQDGIRVRAAAGASSFRRLPNLGKAMKKARQRIARLKAEIDDDPDAGNRRRRAAEERAARETEARLAAAVAECQRLEAGRKARDDGNKEPEKSDETNGSKKPKREPRVSTTDPEARVIKMADGGFRPAWNCQVASDPQGQVVLAVAVSPSSSDRGLMRPMIERLRDRFGAAQKRHLVDGGYTDHADIEWAASPEGGGVKVYCPLAKSKHKTAPEKPRPGDGPGILAWRRRMVSPTGKAIYRRRATAECINAHFRWRGLTQVFVRGAAKVRAVLLWQAIAHNITRMAMA